MNEQVVVGGGGGGGGVGGQSCRRDHLATFVSIVFVTASCL
jgi:hypothetical protein